MSTKLIYLNDSYLQTTKAKVVGVEAKGDQLAVSLDQTIFYPQGGGQLSDRGTIESDAAKFEVTQVNYNNGEPLHIGNLKQGELNEGDEVELKIDWGYRYTQMQAHTAGHILDEAVKQLFPDNPGTQGSHGIGKKYYVKFKGEIPAAQQSQIQKTIDQIIKADELIETRMVTKKQIEAEGIHIPFKLPENKPLRIIRVGNRSWNADGGTQLKSTGESWPIKLIKTEISKDSTTIHYQVQSPTEKTNQPTESSNNEAIEQFSHELNTLQSQFQAEEITPENLEDIKTKYLGKKGLVNQLAKHIPNMSTKDRKQAGKKLNQFKNHTQDQIRSELKPKTSNLEPNTKFFDPTVPVDKPNIGSLHPITKVINQIEDIFNRLGFSIATGPEVEWDEINFQKLRLGPDHPSRDTQETYYFDDKRLLRVHTSSVQIRYMESHKPPIRIISPGRVYRRDTIDATHLPSFFQIEGLMVDEKTTLTDLLGILEYAAKQLFGEDRNVRFYGHNFPYTEPSLEVEVEDDKGNWLEILGCGMVHPEVLENCGIDSGKYQGWAFGMGADRLAMLKYGITDIRSLYSGNQSFLNQ